MTWRRWLWAPYKWLTSREAALFEVFSGFSIVGWGVLALQTFSDNDRSASLDAWQALNMQTPVAIAAIVIGVGQAFAFGLIDAKWDRPFLRWGAGVFAVVLWGTLAFSSVWNGKPPVPPTIILLWGAFICNIVLLPRIMRRTANGGK